MTHGVLIKRGVLFASIWLFVAVIDNLHILSRYVKKNMVYNALVIAIFNNHTSEMLEFRWIMLFFVYWQNFGYFVKICEKKVYGLSCSSNCNFQ